MQLDSTWESTITLFERLQNIEKYSLLPVTKNTEWEV